MLHRHFWKTYQSFLLDRAPNIFSCNSTSYIIVERLRFNVQSRRKKYGSQAIMFNGQENQKLHAYNITLLCSVRHKSKCIDLPFTSIHTTSCKVRRTVTLCTSIQLSSCKSKGRCTHICCKSLCVRGLRLLFNFYQMA